MNNTSYNKVISGGQIPPLGPVSAVFRRVNYLGMKLATQVNSAWTSLCG